MQNNSCNRGLNAHSQQRFDHIVDKINNHFCHLPNNQSANGLECRPSTVNHSYHHHRRRRRRRRLRFRRRRRRRRLRRRLRRRRRRRRRRRHRHHHQFNVQVLSRLITGMGGCFPTA